MDDIITPDIAEWTKPGTGQVRRYVNNWNELAGIWVNYYKSGNVCGVVIDDFEDSVSNRKGGATAAGKVWLDEDDVLHLDYHSDSSLLTKDEKRARITAALTAAGITANNTPQS
ncbi:hypothetical protein [uncultured Tessaracoccus sp.]|uniref:hypothetical protein n=1 Tax=uncultured Tessaracoccus sp. TaxID=905023 RepID=UPI00262B8193|nr:hypothetical protein [uncultured Tessaracoccus sp.]